MPFEAFIGLRYLRAKRRNGFISFISLISIVGIALGVAALIIVLSVMNGFQKEIRGRILSVASHLEVSGYDGRLAGWRDAQAMLVKQPHVQAAAPFVSSQGLFVAYGNVRGGLVRGIEPALENKVVDVGHHMVSGKLEDLKPGSFGMTLGVELARQLGVGVGDKVTLMTPQGNITPAGMVPRSKQFTVVGIFKVDMFEFDASLAMVNLRDAQVLERMGDSVSGVRLRLDDPMLAPQLKAELRPRLPQLLVTDWTDTNANYFRAVQIEKRMMTIILTLIVAVAAFNLVSTLVMVVTDKQADIAILRTLGASPGSIMKIFVIQGAVAGVLGTLAGVASGVVIALNLDVIVPVIERIIGTKILSSDVYMIDYLPSDVQWGDVSTITIISLLLALFATLYPSWRASRTQPAEALRYE
ncbi:MULTISPECIES: lipoprotein-releasing ABC transporter permease subunit [Chromobacterium]|uniref:Lipoprotein-releasing ABC transporter permease subunit n=1 Tax=Chromobacterium piscinae TaxID=686831 RepID=A0ABV0HBV3_9NEIS|nr:lipoprotein-releasing ABC transporter permease subunit [Chromobacterium piscinae]MBX9297800.1 lipoprotein-releasing ABC transporter permease subunit [Chromobacterium vaccinii]MBX9358544.1 lipoprotein-releasing ABC transporter permease subunit [Chromobacterium vaccinii]MCD4505294.1 lipoprotein-releasing ABC transporter permease subunit [Chromobacterium piscinae]MCD5329542.1 lipoprotein-releasing ABC transporter permease subunit [Chromobacterium piscinae]NHQ80413.1 lipoprotein-releasing ABC t